MLNKTLLKRNLQLYWHNIKFRFLIVYPAMLLLMAFKSWQGMAGIRLFSGVLQVPGAIVFPFDWFFIMLAVFLIIGDSPRELFLKDYPIVSRVPAGSYLATIYFMNASLTVMIWLTWQLFGGLPLIFSLEMLLIFLALTALYASLQFFISSLLDLGLYAAAFIVAILVNQLPFLSSLMYLRYSAHWADGLLGSCFCLLAACILSRMIKYIDFSLE